MVYTTELGAWSMNDVGKSCATGGVSGAALGLAGLGAEEVTVPVGMHS